MTGSGFTGTTSAAVRMHGRKVEGGQCFDLYSYDALICRIFVTDHESGPVFVWQTGEKWSVTTSKHQTWCASAVHSQAQQSKRPVVQCSFALEVPPPSLEGLLVQYDALLEERDTGLRFIGSGHVFPT